MNTRMPLEEPRERVLIVDDAPSITMLLSRILQAEGYLCTSAGTIGDAKMTLRRSHFDVMLCDVQPPDGAAPLRRCAGRPPAARRVGPGSGGEGDRARRRARGAGGERARRGRARRP